MDLKEIKAFFDQNKDKDDVKQFLAGFNPLSSLTEETAAKLFDDHEPLRKARDSFADRRVTDGIKKYKENNFDKDYQERFNKEHPPKSEAEKRIYDLEQKLAEKDKREIAERNKRIATQLITEKGIPISEKILDRLAGSDENETKELVQEYLSVFPAVEKKAIETVVKDHGRTVHQTFPSGNALYTREQLQSMTREQVEQIMSTPEGERKIMESQAAISRT